MAVMWLQDVYDFCAAKKTSHAIDIVFDEIDKLLWANDWEQINSILESVDFQKVDTAVAYGFVVITYCEKDKLPYRPRFIADVEHKLYGKYKSWKKVEEIIKNSR